jgi:phage portal protein BeeE
MDNNVNSTQTAQQMNVEEITIGNTTYVVKSNAKSVSKAFVKKTVEKMLYDALKHKI